MTGRTIVVSGAAGFIGSHLVEALLKRDCQVYGIDNLLTGNKENLNLLQRYTNFRFIEHDLTKPLSQEIEDLPCAIVLHLASPASPVDYQQHWLETMLVNSTGTHALLELARRNQARFVFSSTSEVYGEAQVHPQHENYWGNVHSYGPRAMYDESKRFAEALIYNYRRKLGVNTGIVRIFNTYGPRMRPYDGRVVINFLAQALAGKPLTIHGSGKQTRSFCYVDDTVDGIVKMSESNAEGPINLGTTQEFSINELVACIEKIMQKKMETVQVERPEEDPSQRKPDIALARQVLHWEPRVSLEEGLLRTLEWLKGGRL